MSWGGGGGDGGGERTHRNPFALPYASSLVELLNKRSPKQCHMFDNGSAHYLF